MALTGLDLLTLEFWDKGMCRCVWAPFLFLPSPLPRTSLFQIQSLLFHFPSKKKEAGLPGMSAEQEYRVTVGLGTASCHSCETAQNKAPTLLLLGVP